MVVLYLSSWHKEKLCRRNLNANRYSLGKSLEAIVSDRHYGSLKRKEHQKIKSSIRLITSSAMTSFLMVVFSAWHITTMSLQADGHYEEMSNKLHKWECLWAFCSKITRGSNSHHPQLYQIGSRGLVKDCLPIEGITRFWAGNKQWCLLSYSRIRYYSFRTKGVGIDLHQLVTTKEHLLSHRYYLLYIKIHH